MGACAETHESVASTARPKPSGRGRICVYRDTTRVNIQGDRVGHVAFDIKVNNKHTHTGNCSVWTMGTIAVLGGVLSRIVADSKPREYSRWDHIHPFAQIYISVLGCIALSACCEFCCAQRKYRGWTPPTTLHIKHSRDE
jgi:hypothetical protein